MIGNVSGGTTHCEKINKVIRYRPYKGDFYDKSSISRQL